MNNLLVSLEPFDSNRRNENEKMDGWERGEQ